MAAAGSIGGSAEQRNLGPGGGKGAAWAANAAGLVSQHSHHVADAELAAAGGFLAQQLCSTLEPRVGRFKITCEKKNTTRELKTGHRYLRVKNV